MQEVSLDALYAFSRNMNRRRLPVGRYTVAVGGTHKRAQRRGADRIVLLCAAALAAADDYIDLRRRRQARREARGGGRAAAADKRVDARVRSIHKHLTSCVETFEGSPKGDEAQRLLDAYFPEGLGAVIGAAYEEELVLAEHMAEAFSGTEAEVIDGLGARIFVDALDDVLPEYRDALALEDLVSATQVAEARDVMHLALLRVVATVLADHGHDVEATRDLLAPIDDQDRRVAALYAARRRGQATGALDIPVDEAAAALAEEAGDGAFDAAFDEEEAAADAVDLPEADAPGAPGPLAGNPNINLPIFAPGADRD